MATLTTALTDHLGKQPSAPSQALVVTVTPDSANYTPNGEAFDAEGLFQTLAGHDNPPAKVFVIGEPKGNFMVQYDRATKKLKYFLVSTGAEAGAIDLSTTPGPMLVKIEAQ